MGTTPEPVRRSLHRSPLYPGIGLESAIAKAAVMHQAVRLNSVATEALAQHLGYKSSNGPAGVTIAALKKFGLVSDEGVGGKRQIRLTERARRIILDADDRSALLKESALEPAIHRDLWERYGNDLPPRESLRKYLVVERNFNPRSVDEFVDEYIETLGFAGLLAPDGVERNDEEHKLQEPEALVSSMSATAEVPLSAAPASPSPTPSPSAGQGMRTYPLPVLRRRDAILQVPIDFDEADWNRMMIILEAMRPSIIDAGDGER